MTAAEALRRLQAAGKTRQIWLPGMLARIPLAGTVVHARIGGDERWRYLSGIPVGSGAPNQDQWMVEIDDPATRGCLLALLREASEDPRARPEPYLLGSHGWHITGRGGLLDLVIDAPSEGEAIAAALVALAGGA